MAMCNKCGGRGFIAMYKHVQGGICFTCNGTGLFNLEDGYPSSIKNSHILENRKDDPFLNKVKSLIKQRDSSRGNYVEEQGKDFLFASEILNDVERKLNDFIINGDRLGPSYHKDILNNLKAKLLEINFCDLNEFDCEKYHSINYLITKRLDLL